MFEAVRLGPLGLAGEVVRIRDGEADIRACEDTTGLRVGEDVLFTGELLGVDLGPGLLGGILDGTGRPLRRPGGDGIHMERGRGASALPEDRTWRFVPSVGDGDAVGPGDVLGTVVEGSRFPHLVLFPPNLAGGKVEWIAPGDRTVRECVCRLEGGTEVALSHRRELRVPRPFGVRLPLNRPLLTGQRVLDTLFPLALGGVAALVGGCGTGKTLMQRSLARCCGADVLVWIGCGERGNEITEILEEFSTLTDPRGIPLMERAVLIANTSDMPAAARETGICLGMTVAEYYRDMGYDVVVTIDSVSRWTEAPGEEGFSVSLDSRLSRWCERAGCVETLGQLPRRGSVTLINAVSPAGGDFSEPATQTARRLSGAFWGLDGDLARARHFPAVNCGISCSLYESALSDALIADAGEAWPELTEYLRSALSRERELSGRGYFAGGGELSGEDKWALYHVETLRVVYLRQDIRNAEDARTPLRRSAALLQLLRALDERVKKAMENGLCYDEIVAVSVREDLMGLRDLSEKNFPGEAEGWLSSFSARLSALEENAKAGSSEPESPMAAR
jgi:V/A-type H+-transporting ATPase subunit A